MERLKKILLLLEDWMKVEGSNKSVTYQDLWHLLKTFTVLAEQEVCGTTHNKEYSDYLRKYPEPWPVDDKAEKVLLSIPCDSCGQLLSEPGALIFHPPIDGMCRKEHVCCSCFYSKSLKHSKGAKP